MTANVIEVGSAFGEADAFRPTARTRTARTGDWRARFARYLALTDALALVWVVFGTQIAWLGFDADIATRDSFLGEHSYTIFSVILVVSWLVALSINDTRSDRVIGTGTAEFTRIFSASLMLFGVIAIVAFLARIDIARGFLLISLPLGLAVLCVERWLWRQWLRAMRTSGAYSARALLLGTPTSIAHLADELGRTPGAGLQVVGACTPGAVRDPRLSAAGIDVVGSIDDAERAMRVVGADTIVVTGADELPAAKVKQISWSLEGTRRQLVLAPGITDIAGPRIHMRRVAGLPLVHVETPRFTRGQRVLKRGFDVVVASILILLLTPILCATAAAVALTSPGGVFYRQERVGLRGQTFGMRKFRSMRSGADAELGDLLASQGTGAVPLFKIHGDPRITPIGRVLRKYSIDELPQLFNVLDGSMSLVGPRPQIEAEVALYSDDDRRRLLARPGLTGLWQVSGRSELDWAQAVRLDLYYVENWSLLGDVSILFKTFKAVVAPGDSAH